MLLFFAQIKIDTFSVHFTENICKQTFDRKFSSSEIHSSCITMEAWIWPSDWGIASIDPHCLQLMAYAKFSGAPITFHESANPFWTPKSNLPVFRTNEGLELPTFAGVVNHLKSLNYSADYNLTPKQQAEVAAITQLMEEKLYPALLYVFWLDLNNHSQLTCPWFAKQMTFPLNMYYPSKYRNHAESVMESRFGIQFTDAPDVRSTIETAVHKNAEECLNMLAERLGEENFLFGQGPSSADALLYGYLAPLLKAPFPNPTLQNYLKASNVLLKFVSRVNLTYFSKVAIEYEKKKASETQTKQNPEDDEEPVNYTRVAVASSVAASAMTAYAIKSGWFEIAKNITIQIVGSDDDENEEDDEHYAAYNERED